MIKCNLSGICGRWRQRVTSEHLARSHAAATQSTPTTEVRQQIFYNSLYSRQLLLVVFMYKTYFCLLVCQCLYIFTLDGSLDLKEIRNGDESGCYLHSQFRLDQKLTLLIFAPIVQVKSRVILKYSLIPTSVSQSLIVTYSYVFIMFY